MEKEVSSVKVIETDNGFRIEVTGKKLSDLCCTPGFGHGFALAGGCCCCCGSGKAESCCSDEKKS